MSELLTDVDLVREVAEPPHKWWRNKYVALEAAHLNEAWRKPGEVFYGTRIWPTFDAAWSAAEEDRALAPSTETLDDYLGPVKVNEQGEPI